MLKKRIAELLIQLEPYLFADKEIDDIIETAAFFYLYDQLKVQFNPLFAESDEKDKIDYIEEAYYQGYDAIISNGKVIGFKKAL